MPRRHRRSVLGQIPFDDMKVGPADAAGRDAEEDLPGAGLGDGDLLEPEGMGGDRSGAVKPEGAHGDSRRREYATM
jgi:hypothetical protein